MKTKNMLWAALSMTAALVMTACGNEDNMAETSATPASVTIPYTVTVNDGATTRATVENDLKTLYFADGDKLYITGTNIKGVLDIQTGTGSASATFSGDLTYSGSGSPADGLELTATLVSAEQSASLTTENKLVTVSEAGAVTVNYPTAAYCTSVNDAVQKYSNLTGASTYSDKSFSLTQQTAFLNFEITFTDGTLTDTPLTAVVKNGATQMASASVTTETVSDKVVAKFVLPVASTTVLSSATVTMGSKTAIAITDKTLTGKVYNVKKTQTYTMAANAVAGDVGKLVCTAGHIHGYNAEPGCTAARVAKIIYVGNATTHDAINNVDYKGLALALHDEGQMAWEAAKTACSTTKNESTHVTGASWMLASENQWIAMGVISGYETTTLRNGFLSVGGDNMQLNEYWSSTPASGADYYRFYDHSANNWYGRLKSYSAGARACLAF